MEVFISVLLTTPYSKSGLSFRFGVALGTSHHLWDPIPHSHIFAKALAVGPEYIVTVDKFFIVAFYKFHEKRVVQYIKLEKSADKMKVIRKAGRDLATNRNNR